MAWEYRGSIQSGWQSDMAVQARVYFDNISVANRNLQVLVECYLVTTNGRSINASFSGAALSQVWGPVETKQFAAAANSISYYTGFIANIAYNANGEVDFGWGAQLNTNNVITFNQTVSATGSATPIPPMPLAGLSVARVSDTQHTVSWTNPSGVGLTEVIVQRRTDDGAWVQVGRPAGAPSSWVDTTTTAGHKYDYRVASVRSGRQGAFTAVATVYTTPLPPTGVSAEKVDANIRVAVSGLPLWATAYDVYDNGDLIESDVTGFPWIHTAPNASITHTYTVVAKRGALVSAQSEPSNTVQLITPPNAPGNLSPNGGAVETGDVRLSWQHNPVDTTAQTAYELRLRLVGETAWNTGSGTTDEFRDIPIPANATPYEWQVRTKGQHPDWSPWSAVATVSVLNAPGVAVTQPTATWDLPILTVDWSWMQAQGYPQSAWRVELLDAALSLVESREGSGDQTSVTLNTRVFDGDAYTVRVQASTAGLWSGWSSQAFDVEFVPPADPIVSGGWSETSGTVTLTVGADVSDPEIPDTVEILVERSIDGGESWETVVRTAPGVSIPDTQSLSYGTTLYRVTAVTEAGAAASIIHTVEAESDAIWLSGGPGFTQVVRLPLSPEVSWEDGLARSVQRYDGDPLGVAYAGEHESSIVKVSGQLIDHNPEAADMDALRALFKNRAPLHMLRDPDQHRLYGVVGAVQINRRTVLSHSSGWAGLWAYSFSIEETAR